LAELASFLQEHGDDAAEAAWLAAIALIENACGRGREGQFGRWRAFPRGELRRLRRDIAAGLRLARFAVVLQDAENARYDELEVELREAAAEAGRKRRRAGTLEAERVRLENAARQRGANGSPAA
jgi:hypothetical protein